MTTSQSGPRAPIDPRIRARRVAVTRQRGRHRLHLVLLGASLVLLGALALVVLHTSIFSARHIEVRGSLHTPIATVVAVAGLAGQPPLLDVNPGLASQRLERLPWIQKATVDLRWPDSVSVVVTERSPVATLSSKGGALALVDGSGRVLADEALAPPGTLSLVVPALAGPPGSVLPDADEEALGVARSVPATLLSQVRAVDTAPGGDVDLTLTGGQQVSFGPPTQLNEKFEALESLLAANVLNGPASVDLTVPDQPVVTPGRAEHT